MTSPICTSIVRRGLAAVAAAVVVLVALGGTSARAIAGNAMGDGSAGTVAGASADRAKAPSAVTPRSPTPAFVLDRGRYTSFEARDPAVQLFPGAINSRGVIAGEYLTPDRESGFVRDTRGRIIRIDLPGVAGTQVDKINDRGQIVGNFSKVSPFLPGDGSRGYVLTRGRVNRIDVPGARITAPHDINNHGRVVGQFTDRSGIERGFVWKQGRFTTFDVPGAAYTVPIAINDHGHIVGIYSDADGALHGFLLRDGVYTTVDAPGAPSTLLFDVNNRGQNVGFSAAPTAGDLFAGARGFVLRDGVDGPFTEIAFPGAPRTIATGIDDRGRIVGVYENPNTAPSAQRSRALAMPPLDVLPLYLAAGKGTR
jgi:probable HAF family extracellular repeat protein